MTHAYTQNVSKKKIPSGLHTFFVLFFFFKQNTDTAKEHSLSQTQLKKERDKKKEKKKPE